jgi:chitodextrinase
MTHAPSADRRKRLERLALLSAAVAGTALASAGAHAATSCQPWNASTAYVGGDTVTENGNTYKANWWTQGNDPATSNGAAGSGQPWTLSSGCSTTPPPPTPTPPPPTPTPPPPTPAPPPSSCAPWNASTAYNGGATVTENGKTYKANWWTQGDDPATHNGPSGSGQPWTITTSCTTTPPPPTPVPPPPTPTPPPPTPAPPPASGFVFGSYKDVTINMDWNVDQISTSVTGTRSPVLNVMPARQGSMTWAFASGECGSENWAGVTPAALVAQNVNQWVSAGRKYIISTGGANGVFTCGSDAGFESFIQRYNSSSLQGIDFDIEGGQSQAVIDALVARVKVAKANHPNLRFSFTLATLGGNAPQSLGQIGVNVMNSIKSQGLTGYYINLMAMDYGSAIASNCTLGGNGRCDMAQSAINSAVNLHNYWGVPYNQIEITPMIGGNDATDEIFSIANVDTLSSWVKANGIAGVHFWSLDRDVDCALGSASATCNSYGTAGTWGFTNRFISDLGL